MAEPNPGPAAIGVVIKDEEGNTVGSISQGIGRATNNQAEYKAVITGLEKAVIMGVESVVMYADSELVVKQINGKYRVKNAALKPLYQQVVQLINRFDSFYQLRSKGIGADPLGSFQREGFSFLNQLPGFFQLLGSHHFFERIP